MATSNNESVCDEIKKKWEREEHEMKAKMILRDVMPWQLSHRAATETDGAVNHESPLSLIGGVDISFVKNDSVNACAAVVVVELPSLKVVYDDVEMVQLTAPYIVGFLGFREAPFLVTLLRKLETTHGHFKPQVLLMDGNGMLHPRQFGAACHLGVILDMPCIGVAKNYLQMEGGDTRDDIKRQAEELTCKGETLDITDESGTVLCKALKSTDKCKNPIYISQGNKISLDTAVWVVNQCCVHRIPEPTRQADMISRERIRKYVEENEICDGVNSVSLSSDCDK